MNDSTHTLRAPPAARPPAASAAGRYDMVLLAASAGGLQALDRVLSGLPADFPVPVAVVLHRTPGRPELLPTILARRTGLRVKGAEDGETLRPGTVYVAPADRHLVVRPDLTLSLIDGHRIRFVRSSANPLFDSAAYALDGRVVAVVLTGGGTDATDGVQVVKGMGGVVIAQDPATAEHSGMPGAAVATGAVDYVLPLDEIAPALLRLVAPAVPVAAEG